MTLEPDLEDKFGSLGNILIVEMVGSGVTMDTVGIKHQVEVLMFLLTYMEIHMYQTMLAKLSGETRFIQRSQ